MVKIKIKGLVFDPSRHGQPRWYLRVGGRKVRINAEPDSDEFVEEIRKAREGKAPLAPAPVRVIADSFRALCIGFYGSAIYRKYDARTQAITKRVLDGICVRHGDKPANRLEPRHVESWRDEKADRPGSANELVKKVRAALKWGASQNPPYVRTNVAAQVAYLPSDNPDGFATWSIEQMAQYRARWLLGTKQRLTFEIAANVGVRRSDVCRLGPQMERDGVLHFTEFKGRKKTPKHRKIRILPPLRDAIDAMPDKGKGLVYVVSVRGRAYSAASLGNSFRKWADAAGLHGMSLHGIRKGVATVAAENQATASELQALFGWKTLKEASRYTEKANRDLLTDGAIHKLQPRTSADEIVPPESLVRDGETEKSEKVRKIKA